MQWLPGRPLDYKKDLAAAAEIFADIHSTPIPKDTILLRPKHPAKAIYEECLAMAEHYFTWDDADKTVCRLLETLICAIGRLPLAEEVSSACCIVNTEVNSANFLINEGGMSYLVDWEKPLISEPAQDLAHFLAPTTTLWKTDTVLSLSDIRAFTDSYAASVRGRIDFSDLSVRLPLFFTVTCLRGVTWCSMAMREYSREDRPLVNHETRLKLQKYLSTDFLENILENYVRRDFLKGDLTE